MSEYVSVHIHPECSASGSCLSPFWNGQFIAYKATGTHPCRFTFAPNSAPEVAGYSFVNTLSPATARRVARVQLALKKQEASQVLINKNFSLNTTGSPRALRFGEGAVFSGKVSRVNVRKCSGSESSALNHSNQSSSGTPSAPSH